MLSIFFLFYLRISSNPIIICVRDQTTSKIITYLYRAYMYTAVEHVNNFPITLTIEWNDNGDICIHAGNPFSHHICAVLQIRTKQRKQKKKIQMCQMDIIRVCCLLGSVKKKRTKFFMGFSSNFYDLSFVLQ